MSSRNSSQSRSQDFRTLKAKHKRLSKRKAVALKLLAGVVYQAAVVSMLVDVLAAAVAVVVVEATDMVLVATEVAGLSCEVSMAVVFEVAVVTVVGIEAGVVSFDVSMRVLALVVEPSALVVLAVLAVVGAGQLT